MKNFMVLATAALTFCGIAHADLLTLKPGSKTINGVTIATSATANLNGQTYDLTTVGAGLRSKQVVFSIPVYVAQLMVSDPARFVKTDSGALPSLDNETSIALRLTFLRDVDAPTVSTSFQDGLDANNVSAKDADISKFMAVVTKNGDVRSSGSLTIFLTKNADGSETLAYENVKGSSKVDPSVMQGAKDLAHKIMSIWLGNPADSGLADLKADLLK